MWKIKKLFAVILTVALVMTCANANESQLRQLEDPSLNPNLDQFFFVRNITCTTQNCIPPSVCLDMNTCKCAPGFAQFYDPKDPTAIPTVYCHYEQKKQLTAFLLQFFLFLGIGQFYVGNLAYAIPQLIISLSPCVLTCLGVCLGISIKNSGDTRPCAHLILILFNCLFSCALCGWWLADVIIFGMNKYTDGNGVPLQSW